MRTLPLRLFVARGLAAAGENNNTNSGFTLSALTEPEIEEIAKKHIRAVPTPA
jgi:hypothetical protein